MINDYRRHMKKNQIMCISRKNVELGHPTPTNPVTKMRS